MSLSMIPSTAFFNVYPNLYFGFVRVILSPYNPLKKDEKWVNHLADINDMSPQTGRFKTEENETVNLADILGNTIRTGSLYGVITVDITATPLRLGATDLEGRHTVQIINTGTESIYIGFDETVTVDTGIPCEAATERSFVLDPNDPLTLYAVATVATTVRICEVK